MGLLRICQVHVYDRKDIQEAPEGTGNQYKEPNDHRKTYELKMPSYYILLLVGNWYRVDRTSTEQLRATTGR
jgi:hypothetical protein